LRIISWNVNGIRAAVGKGFLDFLHTEEPDICCIQESKALTSDLPEEVLNPAGYYGIWHSAQRRGYSGVATFTRYKPLSVIEGVGIGRFDAEGRVIQTEYKDFILFNVYFPNGQMSLERLQYKLDFYEAFFDYCDGLRREGKNLIITGDYNTAHKEIDLANPKENANYSGFLPIEREWMDRIIAKGYVDVFRQFNQNPGQYTWWSYRSGARSRNIGWRIDYFFVNQEFLSKVTDCQILPQILGSDHCPISLTLNL
jgi:exodeoxyribonuclease-3